MTVFVAHLGLLTLMVSKDGAELRPRERRFFSLGVVVSRIADQPVPMR